MGRRRRRVPGRGRGVRVRAAEAHGLDRADVDFHLEARGDGLVEVADDGVAEEREHARAAAPEARERLVGGEVVVGAAVAGKVPGDAVRLARREQRGVARRRGPDPVARAAAAAPRRRRRRRRGRRGRREGQGREGHEGQGVAVVPEALVRAGPAAGAAVLDGAEEDGPPAFGERVDGPRGAVLVVEVERRPGGVVSRHRRHPGHADRVVVDALRRRGVERRARDRERDADAAEAPGFRAVDDVEAAGLCGVARGAGRRDVRRARDDAERPLEHGPAAAPVRRPLRRRRRELRLDAAGVERRVGDAAGATGGRRAVRVPARAPVGRRRVPRRTTRRPGLRDPGLLLLRRAPLGAPPREHAGPAAQGQQRRDDDTGPPRRHRLGITSPSF